METNCGICDTPTDNYIYQRPKTKLSHDVELWLVKGRSNIICKNCLGSIGVVLKHSDELDTVETIGIKVLQARLRALLNKPKFVIKARCEKMQKLIEVSRTTEAKRQRVQLQIKIRANILVYVKQAKRERQDLLTIEAKERKKLRCRNWHHDNKNKVKERSLKYREENRERLNAQKREARLKAKKEKSCQHKNL